MSIIEILIKLSPVIGILLPYCIKIIGKLFIGKDNVKLITRSFTLSIFTQISSIILLVFIMLFAHIKISNTDTDSINAFTILALVILSYAALASLMIKLYYKSKHAYSIAANSMNAKNHSEHIQKVFDEQLTIISNRVEDGNFKIDGKLKYIESLKYKKESKQTRNYRWFSIISWHVIPLGSLIAIYNLNGTHFNTWYVSISILSLSVIINSFIIHSDIKIFDGIIPLTMKLVERHHNEYKKQMNKYYKK
ncbi:hypothetical protein KJB62_12610 [Staphylococcus saprophyticus]|uniref:hypothetical protein n=1 Tax=Staphylococcus saprophyticus TaxID=29385 RepID=UPI001F21AD7F|nr:hypothetical protein [Staphylococcus saprophyticus]MCE5132209.1 hypothetical protein [Staphylococcus saprophyticus]